MNSTPESPFLNFLHAGLERGSFETDDALGALLPLMRHVLAAHERGTVAPLQGLDALQLNDGKEFTFDETRAVPPRKNTANVEEVQRPASAAVDVIGEAQHTLDVSQGAFQVASLDIGKPGEPISKPVFLPGYVSWEHAVEHHDEVTDIFSLGMLLASIGCGLDFIDTDDLELFVRNRTNLFALNARLHPVVAAVIVQMTELNRHRRAQDLASLIERLENYRDQQPDLDLNRIPGFKESGVAGRRKLIQSHLRDRLFDMSRRNRLIHYKPTLQALNLTVASVPLVMDYRNIKPEQLFTWHSALASEITNGAPMSLGKYLRFEDAPYIPGTLDKIISEARRDRAEYGFAQLRLVLVFLRWHNLKEAPQERIHSPLLLLPVELTKKRGVRDSYVLDPTTSEAEVNPALRHFLKQLYNLDLPEIVDLKETSLDAFHAELQSTIQASEPAVVLHKVERPQIKLIHERARQRLEQYRRRMKERRPRAKAKKPTDYSYDRENFRPLGLQIFQEHIKPTPAPLRQVAGAPPAPRVPGLCRSRREEALIGCERVGLLDQGLPKNMGKAAEDCRTPKPGGRIGATLSRDSVLECGSPLPLSAPVDRQPAVGPAREDGDQSLVTSAPAMNEDDDASGPAGPNDVMSAFGEAETGLETERRMFSLREGEQETVGNPYSWDYDLCAITLGNFNYRRMTLVHDYANLMQSDLASESFDRIFSVEPKPSDKAVIAPLPLSDQHVVIPCDATQASAIARARTGGSYIIQGPPGTGKSQTITNLIADYVAQDKRVLFVCEKRAAIDVVFHRLRQQGLDELCCLIHDSQTDKKAFIQNLKQTSEQWLANPEQDKEAAQRREGSCRMMEQELASLAQFSQGMTLEREEAGLSLRGLLQRLVEIRSALVELEAEAQEKLPPYQHWRTCGEIAQRLSAVLADLGESPCLARHPFRWLNESVVNAERPLETLRQHLERAETLLEEVEEAFGRSGLPEEQWDTIEEIETLLNYVQRVQPLAERNLLSLLERKSEATHQMLQSAREFETKVQAQAKAAAKTKHWHEKLPADEAQNALAQARGWQGSFLAWLNPGWWRLRRVLNERYDFKQHAVKPTWVKILEDLVAEWKASESVQSAREESQKQYGAEDLMAFAAEVAALQKTEAPAGTEFRRRDVGALLVKDSDRRDTGAASVEGMRKLLLNTPEAGELVAKLAALQPRFGELLNELREVLDDYEQHGFPALGEIIRDLRESSELLPELLPALSELAGAPPMFRSAVRHVELEVPQLEGAIARKTLADIYRQERGLNRFDGRILARRMERLEKEYRAWLGHNAGAIRAQVRAQFAEHVKISSLPAAQLTPEQKLFKKNYAAGRRELEHEFGKTMRYKSIRELAGGNTGEVVRDLKPIWLMSPLSVSDTLPLDSKLFDVVIFDEASQIPLEEAVPAVYRANQVIVVGDEMQLPPTNFFTAAREDGDEVVVEEEGERIEVSLDADSFLTQSARNLPSTLLAWHYRSRYEALISFSNAAFYSGNLFTIPDRQLPPPNLCELKVTDPAQGDTNVDGLLARSVSFHVLDGAVYENRRNPTEAAYIARLVRSLLKRETKLSLGIVAFSEAQQSEIEDALKQLADEDPDFDARFEAEVNREEEDQFCGLFVKNLENVQGDERDIIILSICYGYDAGRRMLMNFGPINQRGGEKRLNVIFSRAKHHMAVVSSIRHQDITNDFNDGANALKNFLHYAETLSKGEVPSARRVLENLNPLTRKSSAPKASRNPLVEDIADALRKRGYVVDLDVGQSRFRCDLGVRFDGNSHYQLGVLLDSEGHYANRDLVERYLMQPSVLRVFGWRVALVLTKDWFHEPEAVLDRLERLLKNVPEAEEDDLADLENTTEAAVGRAGEAVPVDDRADLPHPSPLPKERAKNTPHPAERATIPQLSRTQSVEDEDENEEKVPGERGGRAQVLANVRRFEFVGGGSQKFWEISVDGKSFTVRYGRIGTRGQEQSKSYTDEAKARREADKLIQEKLRKGYVER